MKLDDNLERILEVLADECKRNPETSLTGLDVEVLGNKVGAYRGVGVIYNVAKLQNLGFVSKNGNNAVITQKGLSYLSSHKKQKYYWVIASLLAIGIIISIFTNNFLPFILGIVSSIIAGIIVLIITRS